MKEPPKKKFKGDPSQEGNKQESTPSGNPKKSKIKPKFEYPKFQNYGETLKLEEGQPFDSLDVLSEKTKKAIKGLELTHMTGIQAKTLPHLLDFKDMVMLSKTGTGKTLAFLLPLVELVCGRYRVKARQGTKVIVLSPTQTLARQTFSVLSKLLEPFPQTCTLVCGHVARSDERNALSNNKATFIVATPARLIDHFKFTRFHYAGLMSLVVDEADHMFADDTLRSAILEIMGRLKIPTNWYQKVLVCATVSTPLHMFAERHLRKPYVTIGREDEVATVKECTQVFFSVELSQKPDILHSFIKNYNEQKKKCLVFMTTCKQVEFYSEVLNYIDVTVLAIHSGMEKRDQRRVLRQFCRDKGISLLCTDSIARGIDMPDVDVVLQFDPPRTIEDYIHRVGRTARAGKKGLGLILLLQQELCIIRGLKDEAKIPFKMGEITAPFSLREKLESLVKNNLHLRKSAKQAYWATLKAYNNHPDRKQLNYRHLDHLKLAQAFGLQYVPKLYNG